MQSRSFIIRSWPIVKRVEAGGTMLTEISRWREHAARSRREGNYAFLIECEMHFFSFHLQTIDAVITGWAPEAEKIFARSRSDNPTLPLPDLPCFLIPPTCPPPPPTPPPLPPSTTLAPTPLSPASLRCQASASVSPDRPAYRQNNETNLTGSVKAGEAEREADDRYLGQI